MTIVIGNVISFSCCCSSTAGAGVGAGAAGVDGVDSCTSAYG